MIEKLEGEIPPLPNISKEWVKGWLLPNKKTLDSIFFGKLHDLICDGYHNFEILLICAFISFQLEQVTGMRVGNHILNTILTQCKLLFVQQGDTFQHCQTSPEPGWNILMIIEFNLI